VTGPARIDWPVTLLLLAAVCAHAEDGDAESKRTRAASLHEEMIAAGERSEHQRVLEIAVELQRIQSSLGDKHGVAITHAYRGAALASLARYPEAREALEIAVDTLDAGDARAEVAQILVLLGGVHSKLSEFAQALERLEQAAGLLAEADGEVRAHALIAQADVWTELHDYARARTLYEDALLQVAGKAGFVQAHGRAALGWLLHLSGESAAGLRELEAAAREYEGIGDVAGRANVDRALGQVHFDLGKTDEAIRQYEAAIPLQADAPPEAAHTWICIAQAQRKAARAGKAAAALAEAEKLLVGSDARDIVLLLDRETAEQALASGDGVKAVRAMRHALATLKEIVDGLSDAGMTGTESHRDRSPLFDLAMRAALAVEDPRVLMEMLEASRAYALIYALGGRAALRGLPAPAALEDRQANAAAALAAARKAHGTAVAGGDRGEIATAAAALAEAESTFAGAVDAVQRAGRRSEGVSGAAIATLPEIQSALAPDEALVAFLLLPTGAHALIVTSDAAKLRSLGRVADTVAAAEALDARLRSAAAFGPIDRDAGVTALREALMAVLDLPKGVKRLLISPDGPLAHVPFAILRRGSDPEVSIVPSGTALVLLRRDGARRGSAVLALGDPAYGEPAAPRTISLVRGSALTRLPGTRDEVLAITGPDDVRLLGAEATETRLLAEVARRPRWSALHFACHGIMDGARPGMSALAITPEPGRDGFLTALEVFDSPVAADLVVLSGCQTGRGEVTRADGSMGLARAFLAAGVPRVVVSLWDVDDEATRVLMTKFYGRWRSGVPTARALREAQDAVASEPRWGHPRYWAGWTLWGLPD
jgi:tetratricopeptide (TPR) repeat protein